jgi:hypothetical protein
MGPMKTFTYLCRTVKGESKRGCVTAATRADVLKRLAEQGLTPISVTEECVTTAPARGNGVIYVAPRTLVLGGVAIVALIGLVLWLREQNKPGEKKQIAKQDLSSHRQNKHERVIVADTNARPMRVPVHERTVEEPAQVAVQPITSEQPPGPVSVDAEPDPVVENRAAVVVTEEPVKKRRAFASGTEQVLGMIMNTRLGSMPPPLPRLSPMENIAEILDRDIIIENDDNEQTEAAKINVAYAKQALKEYLKEGGTPGEFLQYYHDQLKQVFEEWRTAQNYAMELFKAGDKELAALYVEKQNKIFAEKGIKPIFAPGRKGR